MFLSDSRTTVSVFYLPMRLILQRQFNFKQSFERTGTRRFTYGSQSGVKVLAPKSAVLCNTFTETRRRVYLSTPFSLKNTFSPCQNILEGADDDRHYNMSFLKGSLLSLSHTTNVISHHLIQVVTNSLPQSSLMSETAEFIGSFQCTICSMYCNVRDCLCNKIELQP